MTHISRRNEPETDINESSLQYVAVSFGSENHHIQSSQKEATSHPKATAR